MEEENLWIVAGVREGEILAGKYRLEGILGVGGMGVVVAARHLQLDTRVALKFLLPTMLGNRDAVDRFAREARAAVRITSEHVARVTDVGALDSGAPFMVMELLEGSDLAHWLRQNGPLPIEQAIDFVLQACIAIADAHGLGIVHRDLKPANLFCVRRSDGQFVIKVLDFGISKVMSAGISSAEGAVTQTSAIMGSPFYMSPEQMQAPRSVDGRTDIWAVGVILYELLTGRVPFDGETVAEVAVKVATQAPPPMRTSRPDLPPDLEAAIFRCLEQKRERRYPNVAQLAVALLPFASRRSRTSVDRIAGIIESAGVAAGGSSLRPRVQGAGTLAAGESIPPVGRSAAVGAMKPSRKTLPAVAGAFVLFAVAGVVGLRTLHKRDLPSAPASVPSLAVDVSAPSSSPRPTTDDESPRAPPGAAPAVAAPTLDRRAATPITATAVTRATKTPPGATASASAALPPRAAAPPESVPSAASPDPLSRLRLK